MKLKNLKKIASKIFSPTKPASKDKDSIKEQNLSSKRDARKQEKDKSKIKEARAKLESLEKKAEILERDINESQHPSPMIREKFANMKDEDIIRVNPRKDPAHLAFNYALICELEKREKILKDTNEEYRKLIIADNKSKKDHEDATDKELEVIEMSESSNYILFSF
ncbi:MAG: hypothetical protein MHMPM18_001629 [Marteilia pararefringens]